MLANVEDEMVNYSHSQVTVSHILPVPFALIAAHDS